MTELVTLHPRAPRISEKIRTAIHVMTRSGASQTAAAEQAGLSRQGLGKALKRAEVAALVEKARQDLLAEAEHLMGVGRIVGLEVALDLALNSKDERIRLRAAEFLAADGKTAGVSVHVDARTMQQKQSGYTYRRPVEAREIVG